MFDNERFSFVRPAAALLLACLASTMGCQDLPTDSGPASGSAAATPTDPVPLLAKGGNGGGGGGGHGGGGSPGGSSITDLAITGLSGDLTSDGQGDYVAGKCGVKATWEADPSFLSFRPVDNGLNRKDEKDIESDPDCDGVYPRYVDIDLATAPVRAYCVNPSSGDSCAPSELVAPPSGTTLADLADQDAVDAPAGETISSLAARLYVAGDDGDATTAPGGLNTEYCLDDGQGRPFRFDPERNAGSSEFAVTLTTEGRPTRIETQPWPDNVGSCLHTRSDGSEVLLLLELDFAVDVDEAAGS